MSHCRRDYQVVCRLPYELQLTFGKFGPPKIKGLSAQFVKLGSDQCLANIDIHSVHGKEVTIRLPETLACLGEGRYELVLIDDCVECDRVEIWFEADCEIISVEGKEPAEVCDEC